jgi:mannose-6-phosphate isomerase-like protein (cupin superfamily)
VEPASFGNIYVGAKFDPARFAKRDVLASDRLHMANLFFEPGQGQASHSHAHSDKIYLVHEGVATVTVAGETKALGPGTCALAKAGEPHEIHNKGRDRLIVSVFTAPPAAEHAK